ncbi:unnamed protein product [Gadus morhua 'NCC']
MALLKAPIVLVRVLDGDIQGGPGGAGQTEGLREARSQTRTGVRPPTHERKRREERTMGQRLVWLTLFTGRLPHLCSPVVVLLVVLVVVVVVVVLVVVLLVVVVVLVLVVVVVLVVVLVVGEARPMSRRYGGSEGPGGARGVLGIRTTSCPPTSTLPHLSAGDVGLPSN